MHGNPWLRILVYQRVNGMWEARGLERDLGPAEARSIDLALALALDRVAAHIAFDRNHQRDPLSVFPPAPPWYWNVANVATPLRTVESNGLMITILTAAHRPGLGMSPSSARVRRFLAPPAR